jgi:hypothetical protein
MAEIVARFEGEWILMRVTEHDEDHWPAAGHVISHAPGQADVIRALATRERPPTRSTARPNLPLYVFRAVPGIASGNDIDAILARSSFDTSESM